MDKLVDPRVRRTKLALQQALFTLLKTQLISDITVTKLCRTAGINRRTFYLHYDQVLEVFQDYESQLAKRLASSLSRDDMNIQQLVATFDQIFQENLTGFTYICLNHRQVQLLNELEHLLYTALSAVAPDTPQARITVRYMANGVINVYVHWINHQQDYSLADLSQTVAQLVKSGFAQLGAQHE